MALCGKIRRIIKFLFHQNIFCNRKTIHNFLLVTFKSNDMKRKGCTFNDLARKVINNLACYKMYE